MIGQYHGCLWELAWRGRQIVNLTPHCPKDTTELRKVLLGWDNYKYRTEALWCATCKERKWEGASFDDLKADAKLYFEGRKRRGELNEAV